MLTQLNSGFMYAVCGGIVFFVAAVCVFFMIRAYRAGVRIGMDKAKMNRVIISSATFAVLPSVGILLGVVALSGSLGTPLPWLRLSVIGALHYETQAAEAAAEAVGLSGLSASAMTAQAFTTIALLMGFCMIWGMVFAILFNKKYLSRLHASRKGQEGAGNPANGFGDTAMTAMFIGLVSAYIGSYVGGFVSGDGFLTFSGNWTPLAVVAVAAGVMAFFIFLVEKKGAAWVDSFSIAASMIFGMASAVLIGIIA